LTGLRTVHTRAYRLGTGAVTESIWRKRSNDGYRAMADVILFHHAERLTPGVQAFAERLRAAPDPELFIYPGATHLFTDESLADHVPASAALALDRTLRLLARWP
jgi:dienelactone hydrolase